MKKEIVNNINGYLQDSDNIYLDDIQDSLCNAPKACVGSVTSDGGNYVLSTEDYSEFIRKCPETKKYFNNYYSAKDLIGKEPRHVLNLNYSDRTEIDSIPELLEKVRRVKDYRLSKKNKGIHDSAKNPYGFCLEVFANKNYLAIPVVSSEKRDYIPMVYLDKSDIVSNGVVMIEGANLYHFGILTSNIHMKWVQTFCGKHSSSIRYSASVIYNNFPWPIIAKKQRIEKTAQNILDIREKYPDKTYAYLYNTETMPEDLKEAHRQNDLAVMDAYNIPEGATTEEIIEHLIGMYVKRVEELGGK